MIKGKIYFWVLILSSLSLVNFTSDDIQNVEHENLSIIPKPNSIELKNGFFLAEEKIFIATKWNDDKVNNAIDYFVDKVANIIDVQILPEVNKENKTKIIISKNTKQKLNEEGYNLTITPSSISIEAKDAKGLFYAFQTILQLLPPQVFSDSKIRDTNFILPCVTINDSPKYKWRGFMLDVSRHFFPKEFIFKVLDNLALHKMNIFHWHLVDDQGWRIEIKKYPKLTEVGAWRADREGEPWSSHREPQRKGEKATYGGFYTQEDIKEIVEYANKRFITIVPEIEMPGHCISALAGYPQYSCTGNQLKLPTGSIWEEREVYCAGNDKAFEFLNNILSEVIEMFPGKYIHIGGDEAKKDAWKVCEKCQARIKEEHLPNVEALQGYFVKRIEKFINSKNKILIGWDEILQGGLSPNATVMSWRGIKGGVTSARLGHNVIFSPTQYCYFDYYQGSAEYEPIANTRFLPIKKVYSFDPSLKDSLTEEEGKHILGVQANLWTEFVPSESQVEYMMFPRLAALSEVAWTNKKIKNWDDFSNRLVKQLERYDYAKVNYAKSFSEVRVITKINKTNKSMIVSLENEINSSKIYYTLDSSLPTKTSQLYVKPFVIKNVTSLKASTFIHDVPVGKITTTKIIAHKAIGLPVEVKYPYSHEYTAGGKFGLTDAIRSTKDVQSGHWQGFNGIDFIGTIDLLKSIPVSKVTAGFLQIIDAWIFLPKKIKIAVSNDGKNFTIVSELKNNIPLKENLVIKDFELEFTQRKVRYLKIIAENIKKCPEWHIGAGGKAFIFIDEIIVE